LILQCRRVKVVSVDDSVVRLQATGSNQQRQTARQAETVGIICQSEQSTVNYVTCLVSWQTPAELSESALFQNRQYTNSAKGNAVRYVFFFWRKQNHMSTWLRKIHKISKDRKRERTVACCVYGCTVRNTAKK